MSKILFVAVNACYNHTNIAIRSLALYSNHPELTGIGEWTINQPVGEILRGIASKNPELVLFSTYIWNIEIVQKLIIELKKILPECIIGAGGPEVSYYAEGYLKKIDSLDFVVCGEGEETILELTDLFAKEKSTTFLEKAEKVPGLFLKVSQFKDVEGKAEVIYTGNRELLCDLSKLPFPYSEITDPDNRIYYYESLRGCPFSCAYCMSSLDKKVRFMPLERVFADIQRFLDAKVRLVKFVDRTFNLNSDRYIEIWKYIVQHHNRKTMFHFEIEAEFLDEKALEFLQTVPRGVMQFEIGVQSTNKKTLEAVGRSANTEKLFENIRRIPETIHSHLDLIAGLPYEDLESFGRSFEDVISLYPDALQLGFLKVLHGTTMEKYSEENGWKWMENPPYETLSTPYMSYADLMYLKDVEVITDAYWNSNAYEKCMKYAGRTCGFWKFITAMTDYCRSSGAFDAPRRDTYWLELVASLSKNGRLGELLGGKECFDSEIFYELLRFDYMAGEKRTRIPEWFSRHYDKDLHKKALQENGGINNARLDYAYSDVDSFCVNPFEENPENAKGEFNILFIYERKEKFAMSTKNNCTRQILL